MRYVLAFVAISVAAPAFGQNKPTPPQLAIRLGVSERMAFHPRLPIFYEPVLFYSDFPDQYGPNSVYVPEQTEPIRQPLDPWNDPARARLTLNVPATAEVWVEGQKLKSTGATREILTPRLEPGQAYQIGVVVRWNEGSKVQERKMNVAFGAGETPRLMVLGPLTGK